MILVKPLPEVSVVVPAHNEAENLPTLITEIMQAQSETGRVFEIVIIDDASDDRTPDVVKELAQQCPLLVYRRMTRQCGQSAALAAGFDVAQGEILVTIDADLQNDPADIPILLDKLTTCQVAIGWRRDRKDPLSKKIISKIANWIRNWMTNESVRDTGCGLKAFHRECLEKIPRFDGMHRFFPTLVKMHGYRVLEVPVNHRPRLKGRTHYNIFNRFLRPIGDLWAVRWLQKRTLRYELIQHEEHLLVHH